MKARFVYEALEFERGRDPKSTIGIGISGAVENKRKEMNRNRNADYPLSWNGEEGKKRGDNRDTWVETIQGMHHWDDGEYHHWSNTIPVEHLKYIIENLVDDPFKTIENYGDTPGIYIVLNDAIERKRMDLVKYLTTIPGVNLDKAIKIKKGNGFKEGFWYSATGWSEMRPGQEEFMDWLDSIPSHPPPSIKILVHAADQGDPEKVERFMNDDRIKSDHKYAYYETLAWADGGKNGKGTIKMGVNYDHYNPELTTWLMYHPKIYPELTPYEKKRILKGEMVAKSPNNIKGGKTGKWNKGYVYEKYPLDHIPDKALPGAKKRLKKLKWR